MANIKDRLTENVLGKFYVDSSCIDCGLCPDTAPAFFRRSDDIGFSTVYRQPSTPAEIALAEEAVEGCPTNSIGNDGIEKPANLVSSKSAETTPDRVDDSSISV